MLQVSGSQPVHGLTCAGLKTIVSIILYRVSDDYVST